MESPERAKKLMEAATDTALLESFVGYNIRRAAAVQRERFKAVFGPHDIRPVQLSILTLIHHNLPLRQSELGKALDIKRANIVKLLDELQERDIVVRRPMDGDRRSYELHLTANGKQLTEKLLDLHAKLERDLVESLGIEERDRLLELLKAFRTLEPAPQID